MEEAELDADDRGGQEAGSGAEGPLARLRLGERRSEAEVARRYETHALARLADPRVCDVRVASRLVVWVQVAPREHGHVLDVVHGDVSTRWVVRGGSCRWRCSAQLKACGNVDCVASGLDE